jgi:hypothetical protein
MKYGINDIRISCCIFHSPHGHPTPIEIGRWSLEGPVLVCPGLSWGTGVLELIDLYVRMRM